jgi:hypothetical protein
LAKTAIVQRSIVEMIGGGPVIREERPAAPESLGITAYWEALEAKVPGAKAAIESLIRKVEPLGVYPEFLKSVNFKWDRPGGKSINLGYTWKYVSIFTDVMVPSAPSALAHAYVKDLAETFGGEAHATPTSGNWTPYRHGSPLKLADVLNRLDLWAGPMGRVIAAIEQYDRQVAG